LGLSRQALASRSTWVLSLIYSLMVWAYFPADFDYFVYHERGYQPRPALQ
jgi:hypothetical protein